VRLRGDIVAGQLDIRDVLHRDPDAALGVAEIHLDVCRPAVVDEPDELRAVVARDRDKAAVVERLLDERLDAIVHSRPVTIAATVSPSARIEPNVALTAVGSNPQWTMQSWQRGFLLAWPYFDHSVSSISSRNVWT
jgi:hypothetical protein